ncbi:MAG: hypothetical protein IMY75_09970 [Chloroflexi bacterium]|nr:hypothetical protein [Chloroflexota bacterium]
MTDFRVAQVMSEMNDGEWTAWYIRRAEMLSYRFTRESLGEMGIPTEDPGRPAMEQQLFNERLSELWAKYHLPNNLWPGGSR